MADTNITGAIKGTRMGSVAAEQTYVLSGSTSTTTFRWLTIGASTAKPVWVEAQIAVTTADGGTTPTISVGVTASGTELVNAASTAAAAAGGTFLPASNAVGKRYLTADTDIYITQGGTPNGAGVTTVRLSILTVNTNPSTTQ